MIDGPEGNLRRLDDLREACLVAAEETRTLLRVTIKYWSKPRPDDAPKQRLLQASFNNQIHHVDREEFLAQLPHRAPTKEEATELARFCGASVLAGNVHSPGTSDTENS
jgi:hypothetical protein